MSQDGVVKTSTMVAIYPPNSVLSLADKHAHPEIITSGLHCTLYYVGDTTSEDNEALIEALRQAMVTIKTPLQMQVQGPGCFLDRNNRRWVRMLTLNAVGLDIMRYQVVHHMWKAGFVREQSHGFIPHMTLQYHDSLELFEGWERCGLEPYPAFPVDRLYLVRSNEVIAQVLLGGKVIRGGANPSIQRLH